MRPRLLIRVLAGLSLVAAAACSDDSESGSADETEELSAEAQAYADAWAASLTDDDDGLGVSPGDADCMAEIMMAELGVEIFVEAGVEPSDIDDDANDDADDDDSPGELLGSGAISDDQADAIITAWGGCTDLAATLAEGLGEELGLEADAMACVEERLAEEGLVPEALRPSFTSEDDEPPADVLAALVELVSGCGEGSGEGDPFVEGIAEEIAADSNLTDEQARCIAQGMIDAVGLDRMLELGAGGTNLDDADPATQQEIAQAVLAAAEDCGVPLSDLSG